MNNERGSFPLAILIGLVVSALLVGGVIATCDAAFDDEDEPGDLGAPTLIVARERDGDRDQGRESRGDCENSKQCSDDDLSPSFDESPVIICLPSSRCDFGENESAALFPPNPERLVEVITAFGQNVGTAAGALAGAIAGGTAGILL